MMTERIIIVDDSEIDIELITRSLRRSGRDLDILSATTFDEYKETLHERKPDLVISDFNINGHTGEDVLSFTRECTGDVPFIIVSGALPPEMEIKLLEMDVSDVIFKDNIDRIIYSVSRVLRSAQRSRELKQNLFIQEKLSEISIIFNSILPFSEKMNRVLELIGKLTGACRVYVFEDYDDGRKTSNTFEWCAEGVEPQISNMQGLDYESFPSYWKSMLTNEGGIVCSDISELPDDFQEILRPQEIRSLLVKPIWIEGEMFGFVGMDDTVANREWSPMMVRTLSTIAGLLANAYKAESISKELKRSNRQLTDSLEEKKLLMGEIHHRVKNNLALISSFLSLERMKEDEFIYPEVLDMNLLRIKSLSLVQELIYKSQSLNRVPVHEILSDLFDAMEAMDETDLPEIRYSYGGEVFMNVNQVVPLGLLIVELFSQVYFSPESGFMPHQAKPLIIESGTEEQMFVMKIRNRDLHMYLRSQPTLYDFSEICYALGLQLEAELFTLEDSDIFYLQFELNENKGSSSAL